jgi:RNA polymerase sigma-70 factor, ECF subfamily
MYRGDVGESSVDVPDAAVGLGLDRRRRVEADAAAFERADVAAIRELVTLDVILEMPPVPVWFAGRDDDAAFMERLFATRGSGWQMVVTAANTQPAAIAYLPGDEGGCSVHSYQVFDVAEDGVTRVTVFYGQPMLARLEIPGAPLDA